MLASTAAQKISETFFIRVPKQGEMLNRTRILRGPFSGLTNAQE
jgi:hypothetical protein